MTTKLAEFVESLNNSLAQSPGELYDCKTLQKKWRTERVNYYSRNLVSLNFRGDNARVFQRVSMNLSMTIGQAACQLLRQARWLRPAFAESYRLLRVTLSKELVAVHV